jgi:hypothetical protein
MAAFVPVLVAEDELVTVLGLTSGGGRRRRRSIALPKTDLFALKVDFAWSRTWRRDAVTAAEGDVIALELAYLASPRAGLFSMADGEVYFIPVHCPRSTTFASGAADRYIVSFDVSHTDTGAGRRRRLRSTAADDERILFDLAAAATDSSGLGILVSSPQHHGASL